MGRPSAAESTAAMANAPHGPSGASAFSRKAVYFLRRFFKTKRRGLFPLCESTIVREEGAACSRLRMLLLGIRHGHEMRSLVFHAVVFGQLLGLGQVAEVIFIHADHHRRAQIANALLQTLAL